MTAASLPWGLHGRSSAELREMFLDWYFRPLSRVIFADHPGIESVILAFAQYWDDEADDAVHARVHPSGARDPVWEDVARNALEVPEDPGTDAQGTWTARNSEALNAWYAELKRTEALVEAAADEATGNRWAYFDNHHFVLAFAPYCVEGATQESPVVDAYRPYAIARRAPDGEVEITIVGAMHQPWREDELLGSSVLWPFDDAPVERGTKPLSGAPLPVLRDAARVPERQQAARDLAGRVSAALAARRRGEPIDTEALDRAVAEHEAALAALLGGRP